MHPALDLDRGGELLDVDREEKPLRTWLGLGSGSVVSGQGQGQGQGQGSG